MTNSELLIDNIETYLFPLLEAKGSWQKIEEIQNTIRNLDTYKIIVVGATGAGKTTFLNTLLGKSLLPSRAINECTGVIVEIEHTNASTTTATIYNQEQNIIQTLENPSQADLFQYINAEDTKREGHERVSKIKISTQIPHLANAINSSTTEEVSLLFIDTPGYDTNQDTDGIKHSDITFEIIKDAHLVLSFWDAQRVGRNTSREILEIIARKQEYADLKDKVFIVLNKIEGNEQEVCQLKQKILGMLNETKEPKLKNLCLTEDKILSVGALGALYCRMYPDVEKADDVTNIIKNTPSISKEQKDRLFDFWKYLKALELDKVSDILNNQLALSNIHSVETQIAAYLSKTDLRAQTLKQLSAKAIDSIKSIKAEIEQKIASTKNAYKKQKEDFDALIDTIREDAQNKRNAFDAEANAFVRSLKENELQHYQHLLTKKQDEVNHKWHEDANSKSYMGTGYRYRSRAGGRWRVGENIEKVIKFCNNWFTKLHQSLLSIDIQSIRNKQNNLQSLCNTSATDVATYVSTKEAVYDLNLIQFLEQKIYHIPSFHKFHSHIPTDDLHKPTNDNHYINNRNDGQDSDWGHSYRRINIVSETINSYFRSIEQEQQKHVNNHISSIETRIRDIKKQLFGYIDNYVELLLTKGKAQLEERHNKKLEILHTELTQVNKAYTELTASAQQG